MALPTCAGRPSATAPTYHSWLREEPVISPALPFAHAAPIARKQGSWLFFPNGVGRRSDDVNRHGAHTTNLGRARADHDYCSRDRNHRAHLGPRGIRHRRTSPGATRPRRGAGCPVRVVTTVEGRCPGPVDRPVRPYPARRVADGGPRPISRRPTDPSAWRRTAGRHRLDTAFAVRGTARAEPPVDLVRWAGPALSLCAGQREANRHIGARSGATLLRPGGDRRRRRHGPGT